MKEARQIAIGLLLWMPGLTLRLLHVGFVVAKVALQYVFLRVFQISHHSTSTPCSFIHISLMLCNLRFIGCLTLWH